MLRVAKANLWSINDALLQSSFAAALTRPSTESARVFLERMDSDEKCDKKWTQFWKLNCKVVVNVVVILSYFLVIQILMMENIDWKDLYNFLGMAWLKFKSKPLRSRFLTTTLSLTFSFWVFMHLTSWERKITWFPERREMEPLWQFCRCCWKLFNNGWIRAVKSDAFRWTTGKTEQKKEVESRNVKIARALKLHANVCCQ